MRNLVRRGAVAIAVTVAVLFQVVMLGSIGNAATVAPRWSFLLNNVNLIGLPSLSISYGNPSLFDYPVVGDWDGNGNATVGVARVNPINGHWTWLLRNTSSGGAPDMQFEFGSVFSYDLPVVGDWDGNGTMTVGVVRPDSTGHFVWYMRNTNSAGTPDMQVTYGSERSGDVPVVGDWNGDGTMTIGVARPDPSDHITWLLRNSNSGGSADVNFAYGRTSDYWGVVGDWNGDGTTTVGVVREDAAGKLTWMLRNANSVGGPDKVFAYGSALLGDIPIVGDWDGDFTHSETAGVVRPIGVDLGLLGL